MSLEALSAAMQSDGLAPVEKLALIYLANTYTDGAGVGRLPLVHPAEEVGQFAGCTAVEAAAAIKGLFARRVLRRIPAPESLFADEDPGGVWFHLHCDRIYERGQEPRVA